VGTSIFFTGLASNQFFFPASSRFSSERFLVASLSARFLARATVSPACSIFYVFLRKFGGAS